MERKKSVPRRRVQRPPYGLTLERENCMATGHWLIKDQDQAVKLLQADE